MDVAYWEETGVEWGVCSIIVIDYETRTIVEKAVSKGEIHVPYRPGYLAYRELPLVIEAAKKLTITQIYLYLTEMEFA